jgi:hypothetical protein
MLSQISGACAGEKLMYGNNEQTGKIKVGGRPEAIAKPESWMTLGRCHKTG